MPGSPLTRFTVCVLLLFLAGTRVASPAEFLSQNRRYTVELSRTPEGGLLLTVLENTNSTRVVYWSRAINWKAPHPFWNGPAVTEVKALLTNDGSTVVLRDDGTPEPTNELQIIARDRSAERSVALFGRRELTGVVAPPSHPSQPFPVPRLRSGTTYFQLGAVLDFIDEEGASYAIWFGQTDQWVLVPLKVPLPTVVTDAGKRTRLDERARVEAEDLVLQHQPSSLRLVASAVRRQMARLVPSFSSRWSPTYMSADTAAACLFLTTRRISSARHSVETLLQRPPSNTYGIADENLQIMASMGLDRMIGDFLLSRWMGETNRESINCEQHLLIPEDSAHFLSSIRFSLHLPVPVPRTNSGMLVTYLIPARLNSDWRSSSDVITFRTGLNYHSPNERLRGAEGQMTLFLLTPGQYRLKMIWARNPAPGMWTTNIYEAVPGDYESVETSPFNVRAGELVEGLVVVCTNRVGSARAYEADDQLLRNLKDSRPKLR